MAASQPRLMPMAKSLPSNEDLHERANDILPPINAIQQIGGTQTMAEHHLGFADVENQRAANSMTRYPIGFLFKAFVVAIVAQLVHEEQLQWHELITTYLPELSSMAGPMPADQLTLIDLLSHQTGLARLDAMWLGANNEINSPKHSTLAMCKQLPAFHRPRSEWLYNNWMYSLAGEIIGRVSNLSWGQALESRVLDQVGLSETSVIESKVPSGSTALPYAILNDKTKWRIGNTAGGIRSTVHNLLSRGNLLASTFNGEEQPLHQLDTTLSGYNFINKSPQSTSCLVEPMPVIGSGYGRRLFFYHNCCLPGYNNCIMLLPAEPITAVVLANSIL
ncbi:beta-lactamase/transpeptidase-like protein [Aspergillus leporis]|uniref:Beta-lactamase/transpeptidase-like protein n=1 Tax=Aspergillus leporis TaxID=41062 RepID=A0A5N5XD25_9EURO|nr:beta-lactamase/transpeptidase-like protein [Aspergillus leporis]